MKTGIRCLTFLCGLQFMLALPAFCADIYVAQNTTGAGTGASCGNAYAASWFNINATGGNTYHLCGTFVGAANSTMLTIPTSGAAGYPIIIKFEPGAILEAPYWNPNGAIYANNKNYITIDGGSNGLIRNTSNGTSKTYKAGSSGINMSGSNLVIKNIKVDNIYQNEGYTAAATDSSGTMTFAININSNGTGNITIDNNYLANARAGLNFGFSNGGGQNIDIKNNITKKHCWGMYLTANSDTNVTISNFKIHHNDISDWSMWSYPAGSYHQDGIMISGHGTVTNNPINIYNNNIRGLAGGSVTASVYCTYDGILLPGPSCVLYNNIFSPDSVLGGVGTIALANGKNNYVYNNTIIGKNNSYGIIMANGGTVVNIVNNIFAHLYRGTGTWGGAWRFGTVDYNIWYDINEPSGGKWSDGAIWYNTLAEWRAAGYDVHGYYTDPKFVSLTNLQLQASSPAINHGTSSTSPITITTDYKGISRPQGAAIDIGAYEYNGIVGSSLTPSFPTIMGIGQ